MEKYGWVDSHAHLADACFKEDIDDVLKRATEANLDHILVICLSFEELEKGLRLQKRDSRIDLAFGFFPTEYNLFTEENKKKMEEVLENNQVVAVGEIGLDYYWETAVDKREKQKEMFIYQINLAKKYNKPILVHSRDAAEDTLNTLKNHPWKGVLHCYSYGVEMAKKFVDMGYVLSLAGPLTFKNSKVPKEIAEQIPLESLLIETDCPYLTPEPHRGKRNETSYVRHVGEKIAELKKIENEVVQQTLKKTYRNLFK